MLQIDTIMMTVIVDIHYLTLGKIRIYNFLIVFVELCIIIHIMTNFVINWRLSNRLFLLRKMTHQKSPSQL